MSGEKSKATIIVHNSDMDKVYRSVTGGKICKNG